MLLEEMLNEYQIETAPDDHHHSRSGWIQFDCPFCGQGNRKYHMGYNTSGGYTNCWNCGHHRLEQTIAELLRVSDREAHRLVRQLDVQPFERKKFERRGLKLPKGLNRKLAEPHRLYLEGRGFDPDEIERVWSVGSISIARYLSWRVWIPIIHKGQVVSWTTRSISDGAKSKYLTAAPEDEAVDHRSVLYGMDYCYNACIIHEGPIDVWRTGPGAVAVLGVNPSLTQVRMIADIPLRIVCFDSESRAQERASKLFHALDVFPGETMQVELETGSDAASASDKEIVKLRQLLG